MDSIRRQARDSIDACRADFENPMEFLDNLTWIYDDLVVIEDQFQDRFPPDWKVGIILIHWKGDFRSKGSNTLLSSSRFTPCSSKPTTKRSMTFCETS